MIESGLLSRHFQQSKNMLIQLQKLSKSGKVFFIDVKCHALLNFSPSRARQLAALSALHAKNNAFTYLRAGGIRRAMPPNFFRINVNGGMANAEAS